MLPCQLSKAAVHAYDPETDAPPAGQLIHYSHTELCLASLVVPACICLLAQLASWLFNRYKSRQGRSSAAPQPAVQPRRSRHQLGTDRKSAAQLQYAVPEWRREQWRRGPHKQADPHHHHQVGHMEPPQQQYASPASDRPFRRTQASRRPPSPQTDRPFRVSQSQRVYQTPDPANPAATNPPPPQHTQTPHSDRPFRVSLSARVTHRHTPQTNGLASPATADAPFLFRDDADVGQEDQQLHQPPVSNGASALAANGPVGNGVSEAPLLFTTPPSGYQFPQQHGAYPYANQQQHSGPQYTQAGYQQQDEQQQYGQPQHSSGRHHSQQRRTPIFGLPPRPSSAQDIDSDAEQDFDDSLEQQQPHHDWDNTLLASCAQNARYITSLDALQLSPEYRQYITQARKRQLTYEQKEKHKLNVYKALRNVDPDSFRQLFSRDDVLEYDAVPLSRPLAALELLLSSAITLILLGLPVWSPAWQPFQALLAAAWLLQLLFALSAGCTSLPARALGIYATRGPYSMWPGWLRMLAAVLVDAVLLVGLPGLGLLLGLCYRLLTAQRQSGGERLLRLEPVREVVRPMHFSPYARGSSPDGITSEDDYE